MKTILTLVGLALTLPCLAFFDDFDGDDLKSHWSVDTGEGDTNRWDYSVADSWLTVNDIYQKDGTPGGVIKLRAPIGLLDDFDVSARVFRDVGYSGFSVNLLWGPPRPNVAVSYGRRVGEEAMFCGFVYGHGVVCRPADEPGTHVLRMTRVSKLVRLFADDQLFFEGYEDDYQRVGTIELTFIRFGDSQFGKIGVDWVSAAVPEPCSLLALGAGIGGLALRRRRRA